jgi:FMN phosphatase YigB (HAD superfamily)
VPNPQTWLLDFDETLASGNITYAMQVAFPKFIREHNLKADPERLRRVVLDVQERSSKDIDPAPLLKALFEGMEWDPALSQALFDALWADMKPELFPDTLPFLERLRARGKRVLIVSNNRRTPEQVELLSLSSLVDGVFTPTLIPNTLPKPHRSLWDYVVTQHIDLTPEAAVMVGDDPWSDGAFAEACGLPCWIVDRGSRFGEMRAQSPYQWVASLTDIPI